VILPRSAKPADDVASNRLRKFAHLRGRIFLATIPAFRIQAPLAKDGLNGSRTLASLAETRP